MTISVQVFDIAAGLAVSDVEIRLQQQTGGEWIEIASGITGRNGELVAWNGDRKDFESGFYRLVYDTNSYFADLGVAAFFPEVSVMFVHARPAEPCVLTLLVSPHCFVTYGGMRDGPGLRAADPP